MGIDEVHPWLLRELADEVAKPLSIIFENLCQPSNVPTNSKRGNITPIFRKRDKESLGKYGPVSLTSAQQAHGIDPPGIYAKARGK